MNNIPVVKLGLIAVSRDCFPIQLSEKRRAAIMSVYGKNKMTSFERYFIDDESTWVEIKDEYYHLIEKPSVCNKILCEFGIDPNNFSHIINGHVPVKIKKGESPIKSNGKLLVIDGGLSKAYQKVTGLAGYTLLFNSHGLLLSAHDAFE